MLNRYITYRITGILLFLLHFAVFQKGVAANFVSVQNGDWYATSTWYYPPGTDTDGLPDEDDVVTISTGHTVNLTSATNNAGYAYRIIVNGTLSVSADKRIVVYNPAGGSDAILVNFSGRITHQLGGNALSSIELAAGCSIGIQNRGRIEIGQLLVNSGATMDISIRGEGPITVDGDITVNALYFRNRLQSPLTCQTITMNMSGTRLANISANNIIPARLIVQGDISFSASASEGQITNGTEAFGADSIFIGGNLNLNNIPNFEFYNYGRAKLSGDVTGLYAIGQFDHATTLRPMMVAGEGSWFYFSGTNTPGMQASAINGVPAFILFLNNATHARESYFVYDRAGNQNILLPYYAEYPHLILRGSGTKTLSSALPTIITRSIRIEPGVALQFGTRQLNIIGDFYNYGTIHDFTLTGNIGRIRFYRGPDQNQYNLAPERDQHVYSSNPAGERFNTIYIEKTNRTVFFHCPVRIQSGLYMQHAYDTYPNPVTYGNINTMGFGLWLENRNGFNWQGGRIIGRFERTIRLSSADTVRYFLFPVGSETTNNFVTFRFNNVSGTINPIVSVEFVPNNPGTFGGLPIQQVGDTIHSYFTDGYWRISSNTSLTNNVDLSLGANGFTSNQLIPSTRVMFRAPGGAWQVSGVHRNASGTTVYRNSFSRNFSSTPWEFGLGTSTCQLAFIRQPSGNTHICQGDRLRLTAGIQGATSIQWYRNGVALVNGGAISGANRDTLIVENIQYVRDNDQFYCRIVSSCGTIASNTLTVTVRNVNSGFNGFPAPPNDYIFTNSAPITLTPITLGGVFSGPGMSGNIFNPAGLPEGYTTVTHSITYSRTVPTPIVCISTTKDSIRVYEPTTPPIFNCPANMTRYFRNGRCYAEVSWESPPPSTLTPVYRLEPANGYPVIGVNVRMYLGVTNVLLRAVRSDGTGDTSYCSFNVSVLDSARPIITNLPANRQVLTNTSGANVSWPAITAADLNLCGPVTVAAIPPSGSFFPEGTTTVNVVATDVNGNQTLRSFTVTVIDTTFPRIINCPADISVPCTPGSCGAQVSWIPPTVNSQFTLGSDFSPGAAFPVGNTTVTYISHDGYGRSDTCRFLVTVFPPVFGFADAESAECAGLESFLALHYEGSVFPLVLDYTDNLGVQTKIITNYTELFLYNPAVNRPDTGVDLIRTFTLTGITRGDGCPVNLQNTIHRDLVVPYPVANTIIENP